MGHHGDDDMPGGTTPKHATAALYFRFHCRLVVSCYHTVGPLYSEQEPVKRLLAQLSAFLLAFTHERIITA